jgi:hypothetical protein
VVKKLLVDSSLIFQYTVISSFREEHESVVSLEEDDIAHDWVFVPARPLLVILIHYFVYLRLYEFKGAVLA